MMMERSRYNYSESDGEGRYKKRKTSLPNNEVAMSEVSLRANIYKRRTMVYDVMASPALNRSSIASMSLASITGAYPPSHSSCQLQDQDSSRHSDEGSENGNRHEPFYAMYWFCFLITTCLGITFPVASTIHTGDAPDSTYYDIYFRLFHDIASLCSLTILLVIIIRNVPKGYIIFTTNRLSFYMRIGILALTVGILLFQFLKLVEPAEAYILKIPFYIKGFNYFHSCCLVVIVILETFIAFKYHQVAIKTNISLVKACLVQLIAKNLIDAIHACVYEAYYNFFFCINEDNCNKRFFDVIAVIPQSKLNNENSRSNFNQSDRFNHMVEMNSSYELSRSVSSITRDYLASFHVEYGVLMAGVLLQLYARCSWIVSKSIENCRDENQTELNRLSSQIKQQVSKCHKAHLGIFLGIVMLAISIFTMVLFFLPITDNKYIMIFIYSWHTVEVLVGIVLCSLLIYKFRFKACKKRYYYSDSDTFISCMILKVSTWAYVFQMLFMTIGMAGQLNEKPKYDKYVMHTHTVLDILQICIQYVLILDTLNFRIVLQANKKDNKPGRRSLALLIFFNLIVWLFQHILGEKNLRKHPALEYYGSLTWGLISSFLFPFTLLNRFIGCVSLAIIWNRLYG